MGLRRAHQGEAMGTKARVVILMGVVLILGGCSTARLEETSDGLGGSGARWGVVSYTKARDQDKARDMMTNYCAPKGYRVLSSERNAAGAIQSGSYVGIVHRTYVRFECE